jgi:hypothetical protein
LINSPFANKSCIGFEIRKGNNILVFGFLKEVLQEINRKFEIVFKIGILNKPISFQSL